MDIQLEKAFIVEELQKVGDLDRLRLIMDILLYRGQGDPRFAQFNAIDGQRKGWLVAPHQHNVMVASGGDTAYKLRIIDELNGVENMALLSMIKDILLRGAQKPHDFDVIEYNRELDQAIEKYNNGDFIPHEDAIKRIKGWRTSGG